jgi:hypothetical protein
MYTHNVFKKKHQTKLYIKTRRRNTETFDKMTLH